MTHRSAFLCSAAGLALATLSLPLQAEEKDGILLARNGPPAPGTTIEWNYMTAGKFTTKFQIRDREVSDYSFPTFSMRGRTTSISPSKFQIEITASRATGDTDDMRFDHSSLKGKLLVVEKKDDDRWTVLKEDGSEFSADEKKELSMIDPVRSMETDWLVFGGAAHKPGDQWQVDASKLSVFGTLAHPTGTVAVEFVEVTKLGIIDYAILKTKIDVEGTDINSGLKSHAKGDSTQRRSLVDLITLDAKSTGTLEYSGKNSAGEELHGSGTTESMLRNSTQSP